MMYSFIGTFDVICFDIVYSVWCKQWIPSFV